jgi:hypothetical protein
MKIRTWKVGVGSWLLSLFYFCLFHSALILQVQGQGYTIDWYKIAGGGSTRLGIWEG